jgi:asparagine synthase (glutamine-hydrolysing)
MKELVGKKEWEDYIDGIKTDYTKFRKEIYPELLKELIIKSLKKRKIKSKIGILFSGGIDSSLISLMCKKLNLDFTCYVVGLENSEDLEYAKKVADSIDIKLKTRLIKLNEVEELLKKTIKITGRKDVVNTGVGCVVYAALELVKKDKIKNVLTGMGADELFAGYARFEKSKNIRNECISSIKNIYNDFERDILIAKKLDVELITPFLDKDLIKLALEIPSKYKIRNNIRKYILRELAVNLGLKKEFAIRKKKAAQYGSKIDKAISKLARVNGFKYKKDYLESLS